ncbi:hypothetical protein R6Q59_016981 [Mikania micrantha]
MNLRTSSVIEQGFVSPVYGVKRVVAGCYNVAKFYEIGFKTESVLNLSSKLANLLKTTRNPYDLERYTDGSSLVLGAVEIVAPVAYNSISCLSDLSSHEISNILVLDIVIRELDEV